MPRKKLLKPPAVGPKILVFDIETAPYRSYTWSLIKTNVIDVEREWFILSFAYGWYDIEKQELVDDAVEFIHAGQVKAFTAGSDNDKYVAQQLWTLFDQADVVVGQNHERFDIKKAQERMFVHGMTPPSPYVTIDTKVQWKKHFSGSAALKYTARKADVALKETTRGFDLWLDCMNNKMVGWSDMQRYNVADVRATAGLFTRLIPWIDHPVSRAINFGHWSNGYITCKKCGNKALPADVREAFVFRGRHRTNASEFQTLQCKRCRGYSRMYQRIPQRYDGDKVYLR